MNACLAPMMPAGVALARKSRWPKPPGRANVNVLNAGRKTDMGEHGRARDRSDGRTNPVRSALSLIRCFQRFDLLVLRPP
jgi:hypothetical protein